MINIIIGAILGAVITKIVEKIWYKSEKVIEERRKPKPPYTGGLISGIDKKD